MSSTPINIDEDEEESDKDFSNKLNDDFPNTFETNFGPVSLGRTADQSKAHDNIIHVPNVATVSRKQIFQPARFVIPSVRMGPPYSGIAIRHPSPYDAPSAMAPTFRQGPMAFRNRLFLPSKFFL